MPSDPTEIRSWMSISISQYTAVGPAEFFDSKDKTKHISQRAFSIHGKVFISSKA